MKNLGKEGGTVGRHRSAQTLSILPILGKGIRYSPGRQDNLLFPHAKLQLDLDQAFSILKSLAPLLASLDSTISFPSAVYSNQAAEIFPARAFHLWT